MEDFIWPASAYKACTACEHVTALELAQDHYQLHVYMRTPGQPASAVEQCSSTMMFVESDVAGFPRSQRVNLAITVGANSCGFVVGSTSTAVWQLVQSDASGASYVAGWDHPAAPAGPFPGYDLSAMGMLAYPMKPCATAPATLCEPACKVPPGTGCGLPEPL